MSDQTKEITELVPNINFNFDDEGLYISTTEKGFSIIVDDCFQTTEYELECSERKISEWYYIQFGEHYNSGYIYQRPDLVREFVLLLEQHWLIIC